MTRKSDAFTFLPVPQAPRTERIVLMLSKEEYSALSQVAKMIGMKVVDIVRYSFETVVFPGILDEATRLPKVDKPSESASIDESSDGAEPPVNGLSGSPDELVDSSD